MNRSATVLLTLMAFAALLLVVAAWAGRRTHNAADFALANRRLGVWLVALSCTANTVNGWLLMTLAGAAFAWGWSAIWICGAFILGAAINLFFIAPRLRSISVGQGTATLFQLLSADAGDRLQPLVARSAILIFLLCVLLQTSAMLRFAGGLLVDEFGFNLISITLDLDVSYHRGRIRRRVARSGGGRCRAGDCCRTVRCAVAGRRVVSQSEGWDQLRNRLHGARPWLPIGLVVASGVALAFAAGVFCIGLGMMGQPQLATRFMAARDEKTLFRASLLSLALTTLLVGLVLCCGWAASILYSDLKRPELAMFTIADGYCRRYWRRSSLRA